MNILNILQLYYLFVFVIVGLGFTLRILNDDLLYGNKLKIIFMYQYFVYMLAEKHMNMAGILILEILTTLSVWFLNILIIVFMCLWYLLSGMWDLFYFCFKKR